MSRTNEIEVKEGKQKEGSGENPSFVLRGPVTTCLHFQFF